MSEIYKGFLPFINNDSRMLILGSFPSVKSRKAEFYYGNPQNRFWSILAEFFGESTPVATDEKQSLLARKRIALWDIVTQCEIVGSADATIRNYTVADLDVVLSRAPIERILINGGKAYNIFLKHYSGLTVPYVKLPSTSPANTKCDKEVWLNELSTAFNRA